MVTKILDHLYLGDAVDALKFEGTIICVMQEIPKFEPDRAYWIPVIRAKGSNPIDWDRLIGEQDVEIIGLRHQIDIVTEMISNCVRSDQDVLVHCMAGIERSPLTVVCYLHDYSRMKWDTAYDYIKEKRPEVANRLPWLNLSYKDRQS